MVAPRHKKQQLFVKAVEGALVKEIDEQGRPLFAMRFIGRDANQNIMESGVVIPYHFHYIAQLKENSLLPMSIETAQLAGVSFSPVVKQSIDDDSIESIQKQIQEIEDNIRK